MFLNVLPKVLQHFSCLYKKNDHLKLIKFLILYPYDQQIAGAKRPIEAIYVSSSKPKENGKCDPLVVVIHGGPHSVATCSFSKTLAYLSSIGYSLLNVNYRFTYSSIFHYFIENLYGVFNLSYLN